MLKIVAQQVIVQVQILLASSLSSFRERPTMGALMKGTIHFGALSKQTQMKITLKESGGIATQTAQVSFLKI